MSDTTPTVYAQLFALDAQGDLGTTYRIDPTTTPPTITAHAEPIAESVDWVGGDTESAHIEWPPVQVAEYRESFHPSEFPGSPRFWEFHLSEYVADGVPFRVQTLEITDADEPDALIGWALLVAVDPTTDTTDTTPHPTTTDTLEA